VKWDRIRQMGCLDREDGEIRISVDGERGNVSYQWSTGDTLKDQINVGAGIFIVTATDQYDCLDTLSIVIEPTDVECVRIPNSFIPNGDGINDTCEIENVDQFSIFFLKLYNNWGNILF